jgi:hypothetical protein
MVNFMCKWCFVQQKPWGVQNSVWRTQDFMDQGMGLVNKIGDGTCHLPDAELNTAHFYSSGISDLVLKTGAVGFVALLNPKKSRS